MPEGRTPPLSAIKAMTGEAIYIALTNGAMKTQAQGLSPVQIFAAGLHCTNGRHAHCDNANLQGSSSVQGVGARLERMEPQCHQLPIPECLGPHGFDCAAAQAEVGVQSGRGRHLTLPTDPHRRTRVSRERDRSRLLARLAVWMGFRIRWAETLRGNLRHRSWRRCGYECARRIPARP
jgi:hypothetical protein